MMANRDPVGEIFYPVTQIMGKTLKKILFQNYWTNLEITRHIGSLGDPLPRLLKLMMRWLSEAPT